ncbi:hypothetical protein C7T35_15295 [Variovorax sp. WS11]|uniref:hypothetical protein n=1 Tax=Variovorax sp. WS11 TaxID=1105204 RepID=UPI000D0D6791|nr:hypothetical protein [Variovorax sp. WS11]NDZ12073.1 hypothetical protein [Variovorax sp. WS11]PSL83746.1 hypothetical protein C7T35_15295 [Variovorax sp. WS11]
MSAAFDVAYDAFALDDEIEHIDRGGDVSGWTRCITTLTATDQRELDRLCNAIRRDDQASASTAQIARYEEIVGTLNIEPGATDWASLRARMNAMGGSLSRTHPDDGPIRYVIEGWGGSIVWTQDTLDEVITEVAEDEAKFVETLDYAKKQAAWKKGVAARKARTAARAAAEVLA